jgi:K+/H+ antiporter YhaU regulatory subunit KhtT
MDQLLNQKTSLHKELSKSQTDIQELAKAQEEIIAKLEENKEKLNEAKSKSEGLEQEEFQLIEEAEGFKVLR